MILSLLSIVQALAAFQVALKYNAQSSEVSKKIKRLTQLSRDKRRAQEIEASKSNVDMAKHLDSLKTELVSLHLRYLYLDLTCLLKLVLLLGTSK